MQEDTKIISQRMKLKSDLVVTEPLAGQPGPGDGVLAFFDMLFGCAALIVEAKQLFRCKGKIGDDVASFGKQLAGVPLDLGNHLTGFAP